MGPSTRFTILTILMVYKTCSEDTLDDILANSIGRLCFIETAPSIILKPVIKSTHAFIKNGGLSILLRTKCFHETFSKLDLKANFSRLELNGILQRNMQGKPAGQQAIVSSNQDLKAYALELLMQFIKNNPNDFIKSLNKSIELVEGFEKHALLEALVEHSETSNEILALMDSIRAPERYEGYEKTLETWLKGEPSIDLMPSYVSHVLSNRERHSKQLIELDSRMGVNNLMRQVKQQASKTKNSLFVINHPDDLICFIAFHSKTNKWSWCFDFRARWSVV